MNRLTMDDDDGDHHDVSNNSSVARASLQGGALKDETANNDANQRQSQYQKPHEQHQQQQPQQQGDYVYSLGRHDVLLGRGTGPNNNQGNVDFRIAVQNCKNAYIATPSRKLKNAIVLKTVDSVKLKGGRFLNKLTKTGLKSKALPLQDVYEVAADSIAIEKVKQALRYVCYKKEDTRIETSSAAKQKRREHMAMLMQQHRQPQSSEQQTVEDKKSPIPPTNDDDNNGGDNSTVDQETTVAAAAANRGAAAAGPASLLPPTMMGPIDSSLRFQQQQTLAPFHNNTQVNKHQSAATAPSNTALLDPMAQMLYAAGALNQQGGSTTILNNNNDARMPNIMMSPHLFHHQQQQHHHLSDQSNIGNLAANSLVTEANRRMTLLQSLCPSYLTANPGTTNVAGGMNTIGASALSSSQYRAYNTPSSFQNQQEHLIHLRQDEESRRRLLAVLALHGARYQA